MAQTIKIKRSSTSGNKLTSSNSVAGELGLNTADKALYIQTGSSNGDVVTVAHESTLKIDESNGRIGINTTSPDTRLDIDGLVNGGIAFTSTQVEIDRQSLLPNGRIFYNDSRLIYDSPSNGHRFAVAGNQGSNIAMVIDSGHRVGIGTTAPTAAYKLDVRGRVRIENDVPELSLKDTDGTNQIASIRVIQGSGLVLSSQDNTSNGIIRFLGHDGTTETEHVRIDASGRLLLGVASATGYAADQDNFIIKGSAEVGMHLIGGTSSTTGINFGDGTNTDAYRGQIVYHNADDSMRLQTAGSERVRIDASGRVGIGTSSPANNLHIASTAAAIRLEDTDNTSYGQIIYNTAAGGLIIRSDENNQAGQSSSNIIFETDGTARVRIDPNGRVGIGTSSPDKMLVVQGAGAEIVISDTDTTDTPILRFRESGTTSGVIKTDASHMIFSAGGTPERMRIDSSGKVGIGTTSPSAPLTIKSNSVSSGNSGLRIDANGSTDPIALIGEKSTNGGRFHLYDAGVEKIAFYTDGTANHISAGNLGIGTTSPRYELSVQGNSTTAIGIALDNTSGSGTADLAILGSGYNSHQAGAGEVWLYSPDNINIGGATGNTNNIKFLANNKVNMFIQGSNGNVGIGTTSPSQPLQINPAGGGYNLFFGRGNSTPGSSDPWLGLFNATTIGPATYGWGFYDSNSDGSLQIWNRNNSTTGAVALTIKRGGDVGIGTSSPDYRLHMERGDGSDNVLAIQNTSSARLSEIALVDENDVKQVRYYYDNGGNRSYQHVNGNGLTVYSTQSSAEIARFGLASSGYTASYFNGNVGIGTASPQALLHVSHATAPTFRLSRTGTGQIYHLTIDSSGRLHIQEAASEGGTKNTRFKIDDTGEITFNEAYTFPTSDGSANQVLKTDGSGNLSFVTIAGAGAITEIEDSDGDTKIQVEESSDEDKIRFDAAGVERFRIGSDIEVIAATDFNITGSNRRLNFTSGTGTVRTTGASSLHLATNSTNRLNITSGGNVGIATTSPAHDLTIYNASGPTLYLVGGSYDDDVRIAFGGGSPTSSTGNGNTGAQIISGQSAVSGQARGNLKFLTNGGDLLQERLRIAENGNVGIGTSTPTHQLHVAGAGDIVIEDTAGGSAHLRLKSSASGSTTSHWKLKTNAANNFYIDNDQQGTSNLTILSDGRAGIGISAPTAALSVVDTSQTTTGQGLAGLRVHRPNATSQYGYVDYDHGGGGINVGSFYSGGGNSVYGTFMFRQHNAAGSQIPMAIGNTGNVGFGTTSPADKIHLAAGNILFERGQELRSKDTGGNLRTIVRVNSSNELEYGWSASGPVKFMGGTSYTERMRVHTNGNIGIGTTSPSRKLDISASGNDGIRIASGNALIGGGASGGDTQLIYWSSGNVYYGRSALGGSVSQHEFRTGGATRLTITSSGYVGIGTTSPSQKLQVNGALVSTDQLTSPGSAGSYTYNATALDYSSNGARFWSWGSSTARGTFNFIQLENDGQNQQTAMSIDTSGNVGIGTTSISSALSGSNKTLKIEDDDGADIRLVHTGGIDFTLGITNSNTAYIWNAGSHNILFGTAGTERMRLNSAGDLLIGKTSTGAGTAGIAFLQQDIITTTRSGGYSLLASRLTSDGEIIRIQRSGTTVGEIGSEGGDSLYISGATSTGSGLRFHPSAGNILPVRNRVTIDSTIDLGSSARRFRNIHASSAVNVGHASIQSDSTTTSATTQVAIDAFVASEFRSAEFTIQVTNSTDSTYHITKVLLIHDGTTPGITEYGTVFTGSAAEATFDADISSGAVRLLATPASTDSMTFKVVRHCITV